MGDFVFGNKFGDTVYGDKHVHHGGQQGRAARRRATILLLSANPEGVRPLQIDEERRRIDDEVERSRASTRLVVRTADALRLDDLQRVLLRHRPIVAHFSGHGQFGDGIQVVDAAGLACPVPPAALSDLFRILGGGLRCVVLNACYTGEQAAAIAQHVPFVIGMRRRVLDDTAILFAAGLYRGLAAGRNIRTSFELARNSLDLHGMPGSDVPRLIARPGAEDRPLTELT